VESKPFVPWKPVLCFVGILAIGLAVRLLFVVLYPAKPVADAAYYNDQANALATGLGVTMDGRPTAFRPPGYSFFLAAVYVSFGPDVQAACAVQAFVGTMTVALVSLVGWLLLGRRLALWAGFMASIYPGLVFLPRVLLSENLSLPFVLGAVAAGIMVARTWSYRWAAGLGLLLGFAVLVRGASVFCAGLLLLGLVVWAYREHRLGRGVAIVACSMLALIVTIAPWAARNYLLFGRFVPVGTEEGIALYSSYWPPRDGSKRIWGNVATEEDPYVSTAYNSIGTEVDKSDALRATTIDRLRQEPGYFFQLIPEKLFYLAVPFDWEWFPHGPGRSRSLNVGYVVLLVPAFLGSVLLLLRRPQQQWVLWVLPASVIAQTVLFYGGPRFRLPLEVFGLIVAPAGLWWLFSGVGYLLRRSPQSLPKF